MIFEGVTFAWLLLAVFLVVGLIVHEKTGSRLGGVLVLPLILLYALVDLAVLLVFSVGAFASFLAGQYFYYHRLVYGRRLLYAFLLSGIVVTMITYPLIRPDSFGLVLAVLPGLFSYNLHREGRYLEGMSTFLIWFGALLVAVSAILWFVTDPNAWASLSGNVAGSFGGFFASIGASVPALASAFDAVAAFAAGMTVSVSGLTDFSLASGITLVAVAAAADGGAAE